MNYNIFKILFFVRNICVIQKYQNKIVYNPQSSNSVDMDDGGDPKMLEINQIVIIISRYTVIDEVHESYNRTPSITTVDGVQKSYN